MTGRLQHKVGLDDGLSTVDGTESCDYSPRSSQVPARESVVSNIPRYRYEQTTINSGIGFESSLLFAKEGANILLADINLPAAERTASLVKQRFPNVKALAVKVDVSKEEDIKSAVDVAVKEFGRLDIMVRARLAIGGIYSPNFLVQQCRQVGYTCNIYLFLLI